jgi:hypothetical protein
MPQENLLTKQFNFQNMNPSVLPVSWSLRFKTIMTRKLTAQTNPQNFIINPLSRTHLVSIQDPESQKHKPPKNRQSWTNSTFQKKSPK